MQSTQERIAALTQRAVALSWDGWSPTAILHKLDGRIFAAVKAQGHETCNGAFLTKEGCAAYCALRNQIAKEITIA